MSTTKLVDDAILAAKAAVAGNDRDTARDLLDRAMDEVLGETWRGVSGEEPTEESLRRIHGIRRIVGDVTVAIVEALRMRERLRQEEQDPPLHLDQTVIAAFDLMLHNEKKLRLDRVTRADAWESVNVYPGGGNYYRVRPDGDTNSIRLWSGLRVESTVPATIARDADIVVETQHTGSRMHHPLSAFVGKTYAPLWMLVPVGGILGFEIQGIEVSEHGRLFIYLTGWSYRP